MDQLLGRTLVLVAHPDDEAVACGALLQRMREPTVVFTTDGAPRDGFFWEPYGSREAYAGVRRREALTALGSVNVRSIDFLQGISDQQLFRLLAKAYEQLCVLIRRIQPTALLTLAYEGGHPDHDCCAFLASILGADLRLPVWEAPLYHRDRGEFTLQRFVRPGGFELNVQISSEELEAKRHMFASYISQKGTMDQFAPERELLRPQVRYDYAQPPHAGTLNYEAWGWPIRGWELCDQFTQFLLGRTGTVLGLA